MTGLSNPGAFEMLRGVFASAISSQVVRDGDYFDANDKNILICGTCGRPRREYVKAHFPTLENLSECDVFLAPKACPCDIKEHEDMKKRQLEDYKDGLRRFSLIEEKFSGASFGKLTINANNETSIKMCRNYAMNFEKYKKKGLLLWGGVGTGKSTAAACIANALIDDFTPVMMISFTRILDLSGSDRTFERNFLEDMQRAELVVFDDLGSERNTDYALEKIYNIIDARYRSHKPMILTTNLDLRKMTEETDIRYKRIYERILEVCHPIMFCGTNWRREIGGKEFNSFKESLLKGYDEK